MIITDDVVLEAPRPIIKTIQDFRIYLNDPENYDLWEWCKEYTE